LGKTFHIARQDDQQIRGEKSGAWHQMPFGFEVLQGRGGGGKWGANNPYRRSNRMSIDTDTARRVAKLARIKVEDDALPALAQEFSAILGFIEQLNEVEVDGVEPMTSVTPQRLKRRVDVVTDGSQQDAVLKNAPDAREGFFAVPKVVE
jgi:aspartyl-tRNA(Asn)/glutamyl-tRNA(Gln) amidotransferase subunit C